MCWMYCYMGDGDEHDKCGEQQALKRRRARQKEVIVGILELTCARDYNQVSIVTVTLSMHCAIIVLLLYQLLP